MLSLAVAFVLPYASPTLLAIANPNDGTAWRRDGVPVEDPLTTEFIEKTGRERSAWKPTERLFVFRYDRRKGDWASPDIPSAKWREWPPVFNVGAQEEGDGSLLVFAQVSKPGAETADFDVQYTAGPKRLIVDLRIKEGRMKVAKGEELEPKLFSSAAAAGQGWPESYQYSMRREWMFGGTTRTAFGYVLPKGGPWLISRGAYRRDGSPVYSPGGWSFGNRFFVPVSEPSIRLSRFTVEVTSLRRLPLCNLPLNPVPNGQL